MSLEKRPFVNYTLDEERNDKDTRITVRLNEEEMKMFEEVRSIVKQHKNSTILKQLAKIGYAYVIRDPVMRETLDIILNNDRKNKRIGMEHFG